MNLITNICIVLVISLFASSSFSASLEEITNYKKAEPEQIIAKSYSVKEIIDILLNHIDDDGRYVGGGNNNARTFSSEDARLAAFNKEKFGNCKEFYINTVASGGDMAFNSTIEFLLANNESSRERHSSDVQYALDSLEDPYLARTQSECKDNLVYATELRSLLDSIAKIVPSILDEKHKRVETAKAKEKMLLAKDLERKSAGLKAKDENAKKLTACRQKPKYKLYEVSLIIQRNNEIARYSQKEIDAQNEGAKISGVVNKRVMYEAGNRIVGAKASNKEAFVSYRKLGGTAKTPEAIAPTINPCASFENLSRL